MAGVAAGFVLLFAVACGGGGTTSSSGPQASTDIGSTGSVATLAPKGPAAASSCTNQAATGGAQIAITGAHDMNPSDATVKVGDTVTWTNSSTSNHQIIFDGGPDCGILLIGKSSAVTFANAGSYHYICKIHPTYMKGTITVQ
jgi:plastocyanin